MYISINYLYKVLCVLFSINNALAYLFNFNTNDDLHLISDDGLVIIDDETQDRLLKEAEELCKATNDSVDPSICPRVWDTIMCWPETKPNKTVIINCPDYINKFVLKNKAKKTCHWNGTQAIWSKTDMKACTEQINVIDWDRVGVHEKNMLAMRIIGYLTSLIALVVSIFIMLSIKRLRIPRNYVHINLFITFALRTILTIVSREIIISTKSKIQDIDPFTSTICRISVFLFRYTGAVYNCAIFSEALYLVLLLRFPFYSEKIGCKFCIILSWTLPLMWVIPWLITRLTVKLNYDKIWCWQVQSPLNLILKIPDTILLVVNLICAGYIIRTLYAKLNCKVSREKVIKYRRIAKSIFILIPVFGLHFILFAWASYAKMSIEVSIFFNYIESFFNAFQGLAVSIACCFLQPDVRFELLIFIGEHMSSARCYKNFPCCSCCDPQFTIQTRQRYHSRQGIVSSTIRQSRSSVDQLNDSKQKLTENSKIPRNISITGSLISATDEQFASNDRDTSFSIKRDSNSSSATTRTTVLKCCNFSILECLFDKTKRNDFHQTHHHHHKNRTKASDHMLTRVKNHLKHSSSSPRMNKMVKFNSSKASIAEENENLNSDLKNDCTCKNINANKIPLKSSIKKHSVTQTNCMNKANTKNNALNPPPTPNEVKPIEKFIDEET